MLAFLARTGALFAVTAALEILGCYLVFKVTRGGAPWLLVPAALALGAFAWLLTLHPTAAGRIYAAYGGVYVCTALAWLWLVEGMRPTGWDVTGGAVCLAGMAIIMVGARTG